MSDEDVALHVLVTQGLLTDHSKTKLSGDLQEFVDTIQVTATIYIESMHARGSGPPPPLELF